MIQELITQPGKNRQRFLDGLAVPLLASLANPNKDGCWVWTGAVYRLRHQGRDGTTTRIRPYLYLVGADGKVSRTKFDARRVAWEIHIGPLCSEDWLVRDTFLCRAPRHEDLGFCVSPFHHVHTDRFGWYVDANKRPSQQAVPANEEEFLRGK